MKRTIQSCVCIYLVFLIFCIEKITGDSIPLTQKERFLKRYPNIFFEGHFFWSRSLTPLFHVNIFPRKPKSTKPQCSKEARNACMRFKGFCSPPCFSLDVRISLKPPRYNQGIECREWRCCNICQSLLLRPTIEASQSPWDIRVIEYESINKV